MYKDVGKRILAVMLCICMLVAMGTVSNLTSMAEGETEAGIETTAAEPELTVSPFELTKVYDGDKELPKFTVSYDGKTLEKNEYTVSVKDCAEYPENKGLYTVMIMYKVVDESGVEKEITTDVPYEISPKDLRNGIVVEEKQVCTGQPLDIDDLISLCDEKIVKDGKPYPLVGVTREESSKKNGDFIYRISGDIKDGKAGAVGGKITVEIEGCRNYGLVFTNPDLKNKYTYTFTIQPRKFNEILWDQLDFIYDVDENGKAINQVPNITVKADDDTVLDPSYYDVTYWKLTPDGEKDGDPIPRDTITEAGKYGLEVRGKGEYQGTESDLIIFWIRKNLEDYEYNGIEANYENVLIYSGEKIYPEDVEITDNGRPVDRAYYTVRVVGDSTDANKENESYNITIEGRDVYFGAIIRYGFKIRPINLESLRPENIKVESKEGGSVYYSPQFKEPGGIDDTFESYKPNVKLTYNHPVKGVIEIPEDFYIVEFLNDTKAGDDAIVKITSKNSNVTGEVSEYFTIEKRPLTAGMIRLLDHEFVFDGTAQRPRVIVSVDGITLQEGVDYRVRYSSDVNPGGNPQVTVEAVESGNYTGSVSESYAINRADISQISSLKVDIKDAEYTGTAIDPEVAVSYVNSNGETVTLTKNLDYKIEKLTDDYVNAGTGKKIKIVGMGNYTGEVERTFSILKKDLASGITVKVEPETATYTGEAIEPRVTLYNSSNREIPKNQYKYEYSKNTNAGTASVIITPADDSNFTGSITKEFKINPQLFTSGNVEVRVRRKATSDSVEEAAPGRLIKDVVFDYRGEPVVPSDEYYIDVYCNNGDKLLLLENVRDYNGIGLSSNEQPGTGKITINANRENSNFVGSASVDFRIKGQLQDTTITVKEQGYTGEEIDIRNGKDVTVIYNYGNIPLVYGTDYKIEYVDGADYTNVNKGCSFTIVPGTNGAYTGFNTGTFAINKKALDAEDIEISVPDQMYTGEPISLAALKEAMAITCNGNEILNKNQYEVEYIDRDNTAIHTNASDAVGLRVTVTDITANFTGSRDITFKILKRNLNVGETNVTISNGNLLGQESFGLAPGKGILPLNVEVTYTGKDGLSFDNKALTYDVTLPEETTVGKKTLTITGTGNFEGTIDADFMVYGNLATGLNTSWKDGKNVTEIIYDDKPEYNGGETNPEVTILYRGEELIKDVDFDLVYNGKRNAATGETDPKPTITITPKGNYQGILDKLVYTIQKCDIQDAYEKGEFVVNVQDEDLVYDETAKTPAITITHNGNDVALDAFEISYENNTNGRDKTDENPPAVILTPKESSNYCGEPLKVPFTIKGIHFENYDVSIEFTGSVTHGGNVLTNVNLEEPLPFDGLPYIPEILITVTPKDGGEAMILNPYDESGAVQDYEIDYGDNRNAGIVTIKIKGRNNFDGDLTKTFEIKRKEISMDKVVHGEYIINIEDEYYTGDEINPAGVTVYDTKRADASAFQVASLYMPYADDLFKGYEMQRDEDYVVQPAEGKDNVNAGSTSAEIHGMKNYVGTADGPFVIEPLDLGKTDVVRVEDIPTQTYKGEQLRPEIKIYVTEQILLKNTNYQVEYGKNINVADGGIITIKPKANNNKNVIGSRTIHFNINPKNLADREEIAYSPNIPDQTLSGNVAEPKLDIYYVTGSKVYTLVPDTDYVLNYRDNSKYGTGYVSVVGKENFTGAINDISFNIVRDINADNVRVGELERYYQYTGREIQPMVELFWDGEAISKTNYDLSYDNNIDGGTATITIIGKNGYTGSRTITFEITRDISGVVETSFQESETYTGGKIQVLPTRAVKVGSSILKEGKDYTLSYKNNTNVGTATVTITGMGVYSGSKDYTFQIVPKSIALCEVSPVANMIYDGSPARPAVTVTNSELARVKAGSTTLVEGRDYSLTYLNNEKPGTARVIISGQGNYTGSQVVEYKISLEGVSGLKATSNSSTKAALSWNVSKAVTGYEIYGSGNVRIARTDSNSYTFAGLNAKTTYTYRVRSYTVVGGQISYSAFSTVTVTTK